ncbi:MAG TPA: DUF1799 domain-containing protein, partial [Hyphomicrobiales bacterium]|nr:DUF1799 domain-containing protein [Hyphomicrobiales bacterium]
MEKDLAFFGASSAQLPAWLRNEPDEQEFTVYAVNVPAWTLFARMGTQWRHDGWQRSGLDYNVLFQIMDRQGLDHAEQLLRLDQVSIIE